MALVLMAVIILWPILFSFQIFHLYLRSTLFEKINITAGANLDPYQRDSLGRPVNKYAWSG